MVFKNYTDDVSDKVRKKCLEALVYASAALSSGYAESYLRNTLSQNPNFSDSWTQVVSISSYAIVAASFGGAGWSFLQAFKYTKRLSDGDDRGLKA